MNILYIGYWGANEGLSQATINPHLEILASIDAVKRVVYVSIERRGDHEFNLLDSKKLTHIPFFGDRTPFRVLNKVLENFIFGKKLIQITRRFNVNLVICRTSLAGNFGLILHSKLGVQFVVESFEPHAEYMAELGIWPRMGLSFRYQYKQEQRQKKYAAYLYPVSEGYRKKLISEGIPTKKVTTVPCSVDIKKFDFNKEVRSEIRAINGIPGDAVVGIYIGKFGGIYFDLPDSFGLFKMCLDYFVNFRLILLTPTTERHILEAAEHNSFPLDRLIVQMVNHHEVPQYLSSADFAFSLHKPMRYSLAYSPIKNGEYWANGLPILIPEGIGDDSEIVMRHPEAGCTFRTNPESMKNALNLIQTKLNNREVITRIARRYRGFVQTKKAYRQLIELN